MLRSSPKRNKIDTAKNIIRDLDTLVLEVEMTMAGPSLPPGRGIKTRATLVFPRADRSRKQWAVKECESFSVHFLGFRSQPKIYQTKIAQ